MADLSIKVAELREALKIVKGVQSSTREIGSSLKNAYGNIVADFTFDDLMELKDSVYLLKTGDLVSCNWGGQFKIGYIIDPVVRYNGYMKFSKNHSERAAIVRFLSKSSTGYTYSTHEVVPYRVIAKVMEVQKGIVTHVESLYRVKVDIVEGERFKGIKNLNVECNENHGYAPNVEVEVFHTKDILVVDYNNGDMLSADRFYVYKPWDEKDITKISGYGL